MGPNLAYKHRKQLVPCFPTTTKTFKSSEMQHCAYNIVLECCCVVFSNTRSTVAAGRCFLMWTRPSLENQIYTDLHIKIT